MDLIRIGNKLCGADDSRIVDRMQSDSRTLKVGWRSGILVGLCDELQGSSTTHKTTSEVCKTLRNAAKKVNEGDASDLLTPLSFFQKALSDANYSLRKNHHPCADCAFVIISERMAYIAKVGDCRVLILRNGIIKWDSQTAFVSTNTIEHLGYSDSFDIKYEEIEIFPGDKIVLMSKGIVHMMQSIEVLHKFLTANNRPAEIVGNILDNCDILGKDNSQFRINMSMTLVVVPDKSAFHPTSASYGKSTSRKSGNSSGNNFGRSIWKWILTILIIAAGISAGLNVYWYFQKESDQKELAKSKSHKSDIGTKRMSDDLRISREFLKVAKDQLVVLKDYGKNNPSFKYDDKKMRNSVRRHRKIYVGRAIRALEKAAEKENSENRRRIINNIKNSIKRSKVIYKGIDSDKGLSTAEAENEIDKFISQIENL